MCAESLRRISTELKVFQQKPKLIEGRKIHDWFKVGENLFEYFYRLGLELDWDYSKLQCEEETKGIISLITNNKEWLESFLSLYPNLRINFDLVCSADDICKTRSGLEVLLRGFVNINSEFDNVLNDIENMGEVEEFDSILKTWSETGHRPSFSAKDQSIPKSHWWWF